MEAALSTVLIPAESRRSYSVRNPERRGWSGAPGFGLATVGITLGLGSAWRLPVLLDLYGGGAFLLMYLAALVAIGLPVLMAELMIGRRGRATPAGCYDRVARQEGRPCRWRWIAGIGAAAGTLILGATSSIPATAALWLVQGKGHASMGAGVIAQGLLYGLLGAVAATPERFRSRLLVGSVGAVLVLLLGITVRALMHGPSVDVLLGVLEPDPSRTTAHGALDALRLALLTLGLCFGTVMTYGAELPSSRSIVRVSGVMLLSAVAAAVLVLLLVTATLSGVHLPPLAPEHLLLGQIPLVLGAGVGTGLEVWYAMVLVAGVLGGFAVLESASAQFTTMFRMRRGPAVLLSAGAAWLVATAGEVAGPRWHLDRAVLRLATDVLVPGAVLGLAIFAGWAMSRRATRTELGLGSSAAFRLWRGAIRYGVPAVLTAVVVAGLAGLLAR